MFGGRKKDPEPAGPYKVEKVAGTAQLEKLLNTRHAEGYEVVAILQNQAFGSNAARDVVFRMRQRSGGG